MGLLILRSSIVPDTTPNQFTFTDQNGVALSSTITSAAVTIAGLGAGQSAAVTASGGTADINASGTFSTSPGSVQNGDQVRARVTSSASNSTAVTANVTIGGVSDGFTATTETADGLSPTPESTGGTIVFDSRAGGANSTQAAANLAAWKTAFTPSGSYSGIPLFDAEYGVTSQTVATGVVGSGVKSRQVNYTASSTDEHGAPLGWDADSGNIIVPAATPWYTSGKIWIPSGVTLGGVNPHWKAFIWNRVSGGSGRPYLAFYGTDYMTFRIDERSVDKPFDCPGAPSTSPWNLRDRIIQWTAYFNPNTDQIRLWIKATGVTGGEAECTPKSGEGNNGTGLNNAIGVGGFQDNVTLYTNGGSGYALHTWDIVIWH